MSYAGSVRVLMGGAELGLETQSWTQASPGIADTPVQDPPWNALYGGDHFGAAVDVGDFDGDGFGDLAVGVPGEDRRGDCGRRTVCQTGAVAVLYGTSEGLTADGSQLWDQDSSGVPNRNELEDGFGVAVLARDFNRDGRADLAIGAPYESLEAYCDRPADECYQGSVTVLYGAAAGLKATDARVFTLATPGVPGQPRPFRYFGYALACPPGILPRPCPTR